MDLNGVTVLSSFDERDTGRTCFELSCSLAEAAALDGQELAFTDSAGNGTSYAGREIESIERLSDSSARLWLGPPQTESALRARVTELTAQLEESQRTVASNEVRLDQLNSQVDTLNALASKLRKRLSLLGITEDEG